LYFRAEQKYKTMKINYEHVTPDKDSCFRMIHNNSPVSNFEWEYHYHPEIELVCVLSGEGTRHIGLHKSKYLNRDLVLIGSNVPHTGFGLNSIDPHEEIVLQFKEDILQFPPQEKESQSIKRLLELSKCGIVFHDCITKKMAGKLEVMLDAQGYKRYLLLLEVLFELSLTKEYQTLNKKYIPETTTSTKKRLESIFSHIEKNYQKEICI